MVNMISTVLCKKITVKRSEEDIEIFEGPSYPSKDTSFSTVGLCLVNVPISA